MKIKRDAFLYLEGDDSEFAQCGTCAFGYDQCAIMSGQEVSVENGSCNFYIGGDPIDYLISDLTKEQVGYVERAVRCENCKFFRSETGTCMLFRALNRDEPSLFDLDEKVVKHGCCNANTPR